MDYDGFLNEIIEAAINPGKNAKGAKGLIVANHLRQMKLFGIRQGVEFYPKQDNQAKLRKQFITQLWKNNRVSLYLSRIWDLFVGKGNILLLLRPNNKDSYDIRFFDKDNYRPYYDENGDLTEVQIVYSYKTKDGIKSYDQIGNEKWLKLTLTKDYIYREVFGQNPGLDNINIYPVIQAQKYRNSLGYIPCVECNNNSAGLGQEGVSDFAPLKRQIIEYEENVNSIHNNLQFFGGTTIVTTRSESEILEAAEINNHISPHAKANRVGWNTIGFENFANGYPRYMNTSLGESLKVKKVIGGVGGDERFAFLSPDPVTPDHMQAMRQDRESIHYALGGIDELGIQTNAPAYQIKTVYGKVAATAKEKCEILYDYGLAVIFEMAIEAEERKFLAAVSQMFSVPINEISPDFLQDKVEKGKLNITSRFPGLPPMGSREVDWRWKGDVFEDSPRDLLDKSIVVRNLQEQGVNSLDALHFLFPNYTDTEKEGMLSGGFPFRYINSIVGTLNQMIGTYGNSLSVPNPGNPDIPLATELNIIPFIQQGLNTINKELSYLKQNEPTTSTSLIPSSTEFSTSSSTFSYNQPTGITPRVPNAGFPDTSSPSGLSAAGFFPWNPEFRRPPFPVQSDPRYSGRNIEGVSDSTGTTVQSTIIPDNAIGLPTEGTVLSTTTSLFEQPPVQPQSSGLGYQSTELAQTIWGDQSTSSDKSATSSKSRDSSKPKRGKSK